MSKIIDKIKSGLNKLRNSESFKARVARDTIWSGLGSGWIFSDAKENSIKVGKDNIHFLDMLVTKSERKKLILYWFQAYGRTSPGTFLQKINTSWAKFIHSREDNAFARPSNPIAKQSESEAYITGVKFIKDFYPAFLEYIKNG